MFNILNKKFFFIFLIIILTKCTGFKTLKDYYTSADIKLSENQIIRLSNYIRGEFYSTDLERNVFAYPIAFIISDDGKKSIILACESTVSECNHNVQIFQLIKKYEKKLRTNFKILALEKNLVISNEELKKKLSSYKEFKRVNLKEKENFIDFILIPSDNCGSDDC